MLHFFVSFVSVLFAVLPYTADYHCWRWPAGVNNEKRFFHLWFHYYCQSKCTGDTMLHFCFHQLLLYLLYQLTTTTSISQQQSRLKKEFLVCGLTTTSTIHARESQCYLKQLWIFICVQNGDKRRHFYIIAAIFKCVFNTDHRLMISPSLSLAPLSSGGPGVWPLMLYSATWSHK